MYFVTKNVEPEHKLTYHLSHRENVTDYLIGPTMAAKSKVIPVDRERTTHSNVTEGDWVDLVNKIKENRCTPFLGAGANAGVLPSGTELAESWADKFKFPFADKKSNLPFVAQFLAIRKDDMWPKEQVAKFFRDRLGKDDIDGILRGRHPVALLADLPFPILMTTNYDDLLFRALRMKGKAPEVSLCAWNPTLRDYIRTSIFGKQSDFAEHKRRLSDPTPANPVIFHLHGHYQYPISMVLTESDYYRFVLAMTEQPKNNRQALLPASIQQAAKYNMLLFIGYSLNDLSFNVLFRSLFIDIHESDRTMALAIQLPSGESPDAQEYLKELYYKKFHIKLFYQNAQDFVATLVDRWRRYHGPQHSAA